MQWTADSRQRRFVLITGTALLQGLALAYLSALADRYTLPMSVQVREPMPHWIAVAAALSLFLPPVVQALEPWSSLRRTWFAILALALAVAGFGYHGALMSAAPGMTGIFGQPFATLAAIAALLFHAMPFIQSWLESGTARPAYPRLFHFAWHNAVSLALAGGFLCATWVLLLFLARLFVMLGVDFFDVILFRDSHVSWLVSALGFGSGVYLLGRSERLIAGVRELVLALFKWLAALAILIVVLFSAAMLVKAPELFASHTPILGAGWMLSMLIATVYLYNAAYQDGTVGDPYPVVLGTLLRLATPLLPLIAAIALYSIVVRAAAYGLTVPRAWAILVAAVSLIYALGYAASIVIPRPWMATMGTVNVGVGMLIIVLLGLSLTPVLSPERLAAASLANRILAMPEDALDTTVFSTLRFDTGQYGVEHLRQFAAGAPAAAVTPAIRAEAQRALGAANEWVYSDREAVPARPEFEVQPSGSVIEAPLHALLARRWQQYSRGLVCTRVSPCTVLFADVDRDNAREVLVFFGAATGYWYRKHDGVWREEGELLDRNCPDATRASSVSAAGAPQFVPAPYADVKMGLHTFVLVEWCSGSGDDAGGDR